MNGQTSVFEKIRKIVRDIFPQPDTQHCNKCGRSVRLGSGWFVNRVPDFNGFDYRFFTHSPFPAGDFICAECDEKKYSKKNNAT